jgi:hypothetical protein
MDDEFPKCRNTRWGYRSTPIRLRLMNEAYFIFIFGCFLALAPDFAPPARGRLETLEPVVGGECCDTAAAAEHYGPDAQKEGE